MSDTTQTVPNIEVGSLYRHFKGGLYLVISLGTDEATKKPIVVYQSIPNGHIVVPRSETVMRNKITGQIVKKETPPPLENCQWRPPVWVRTVESWNQVVEWGGVGPSVRARRFMPMDEAPFKREKSELQYETDSKVSENLDKAIDQLWDAISTVEKPRPYIALDNAQMFAWLQELKRLRGEKA